MKFSFLIFFTAIIAYSFGVVLEAGLYGEDSKLYDLATTGTFDQRWIPLVTAEKYQKWVMDYRIDDILTRGDIIRAAYLSDVEDVAIKATIDFTISKETLPGGFFQNIVSQCIFEADKDFGKFVKDTDDDDDGGNNSGTDDDDDDGYVRHEEDDDNGGKDSIEDDDDDGVVDPNDKNSCVICILKNEAGQPVGEGEFPLPGGYNASTPLIIDIIPTSEGSNDVQDVHKVKVQICQPKQICPKDDDDDDDNSFSFEADDDDDDYDITDDDDGGTDNTASDDDDGGAPSNHDEDDDGDCIPVEADDDDGGRLEADDDDGGKVHEDDDDDAGTSNSDPDDDDSGNSWSGWSTTVTVDDDD